MTETETRMEWVFAFKTAEQAERFDPTRLGIAAGGSDDGLRVVVEMDFESWDAPVDGIDRDVLKGIVAASLASAGLWPQITI